MDEGMEVPKQGQTYPCLSFTDITIYVQKDSDFWAIFHFHQNRNTGPSCLSLLLLWGNQCCFVVKFVRFWWSNQSITRFKRYWREKGSVKESKCAIRGKHRTKFSSVSCCTTCLHRCCLPCGGVATICTGIPEWGGEWCI